MGWSDWAAMTPTTRQLTRHLVAWLSVALRLRTSTGAFHAPSIRTAPHRRGADVIAGVPPVSIGVIGLGGGGSNAVNRMVDALGEEDSSSCVHLVSCNTDAQALAASRAPRTLQIGPQCTRGLGAGGRPAVGYEAAVESAETLRKEIEGKDMVFVTAGMGGGTGTGAAPVVAQLARDAGALTIGVVSKPFGFEGRQRSEQAERAISTLRECVDVLIVVSNDRLLQIVPEGMSLADSFALADEVCCLQPLLPMSIATALMASSAGNLCGTLGHRHACPRWPACPALPSQPLLARAAAAGTPPGHRRVDGPRH